MKTISNEELVAALIESRSIKDAAAALGITPRTIYDRLSTDRELKVLYQAARADILRAATATVVDRMSEAFDAISEIMHDSEVSASVRLQAANSLINHGTKMTTALDETEADVIERYRRRDMLEFDQLFDDLYTQDVADAPTIIKRT